MSNNEGVFTNAVTTAYDAEGHVVSQRGATYPVDYSYDEFGDKVSMTTYRDINAAGDVTRWLRDESTGLVTNKVYADGKGPRYDYTPDGKLATRTWARGIVTTYSYDDNGSLTNTVYSDGTPTISLVYNRAGRQIQAIDAAGVTTFLYDDFGALTNETVLGVAGTNIIERFYDTFGRNAGYALNGVRQSTLAYDPATGRLASMLANGCDTPFTWNYLAGSDLKSSLAYPNGLTASWAYDANGQLLQVKNAFPTNIISQYDYVYDAVGRRINVSKTGTTFAQSDSVAYGYNSRSELTNAVAAVDSDYRYAYDFDDIGNRETSSERGTNFVYAANQLNQYTEISDSALSASPREGFIPQFDDDGNQTLIKTATGIWQVTYNGENRPILWENVSTNSPTPNSSTSPLISMSFDRIGRRVAKNNQLFVYDGYLQIANFVLQTPNIKLQTFIWDPTEPVATRPLVWNFPTFQPFNLSTFYYTHDSTKNVCQVITSNGTLAAHYEYAPFGTITMQKGDFTMANPWRFSSEYANDDTTTVYYNYRHYLSFCARWTARDIAGESNGLNLVCFVANNALSSFDHLGLEGEAGVSACGTCGADVGDWILEELRRQIEGWNEWKKKNSTSFWGVPKKITITDYLTWANGNQRYKDSHYFTFSKGTKCGTQRDRTKPGCGRSVTLCGNCVRSSILGNIVYGFVGGHQGYSTNQLITAATGMKHKVGMTVDTYDESSYVFGRKLFDKCDTKITLNEFCAAFNQLVAELPQALREANTNGGYNDLSSCGLCDEKTKETRHGGAEKPRWRP